MPSSCTIDCKSSLPGHVATTFSIVIFKPNSQRKAQIANTNIVVALVLDDSVQDDKPVAIMLRTKGEVNEVRAVF